MKKQVFLLTLAAIFSGSFVKSDDCCNNNTTSSSNCCDSNSSSSSDCGSSCRQSYHNRSYRAMVPNWQAASPELVSMTSSNVLHNLHNNDQKGNFQLSVFGGRSADKHSASYYFPARSMTVTGAITDVGTFATVLAQTEVQDVVGTLAVGDFVDVGIPAGTSSATAVTDVLATASGFIHIATDPATFLYDSNTDVSILRPWNFGITFAALFEPRGASKNGTAAIGALEGSGLITSPAFNSTIDPKVKRMHIGAGLGLRYHFSDDQKGFFAHLTTAVQHVRTRVNLCENVVTPADVIANLTSSVANVTAGNPYGFTTFTPATATPTPASSTAPVLYPSLGDDANRYLFTATEVSGVLPVGSVLQSYRNSGFPGAPVSGSTVAVEAPANVTEAFDQDSWNYGKIGCEDRKTRLADIELSLGYQWFCGDCASTNWSVGVVIPTGNKNRGHHMAPSIVGNGFHVGIMTSSVTEVMLSECDNYQTSYRLDLNGRYLFRNTQKRSFDLIDNGFSRYMAVYENEAAYTAAVTALNVLVGTAPNQTFTPTRSYSAGINSFTTDMHVRPGCQGRINQALFVRGEHFRAELGWNVMARQQECVKLACDWDSAPAFADASYISGVGLNKFRTIHNDSQTTTINAIDSLTRGYTLANAIVTSTAGQAALSAAYADAAITEEMIDFNSASSAAVVAHTPYLSLGYAWESDCKPQVSIGGSYEFSAGNAAMNQWLVWGKFEVAF